MLALRSIRARTEQLASNYARQLIQVERLEAVEESATAEARALLLTNDPGYQERIARARLEGDRLLADLRAHIQSAGGQDALREIERLRREYQHALDQVIAERAAGAAMPPILDHWRAFTVPKRDELAAAIDTLRTRKQVLHEEALARVEQSSRRLSQLIAGMTIISLLLAAVLAFVITRTLVRMYDAETVARQAADDARQWFATTLSSIGDAVIATDKDGKVTFLNDAAEALTAWDRADAAGKPLEQVFSIINQKTGQPMQNPVKKVLATGIGVQLANDTVLVARDGQRKPIDDSAAPIRDAVRGITGVVLVFRDISERRRAEEAIRESKEWLATTLHSIGDAVIATDRNGRITLMNPVAQRLTGWVEQQALGAPLEAVFNIINEDTRKRLQNPVEKVLSSGQVVGLANHTILVAKDGTLWPLDDSGAPIRNAQGEIIGVVLVFREVTERRRTEEALHKLSAIVESSDAAIIGKDLEGIITSWNDGAQKLYGYSEAEALGHPVSMLLPEDHRDEMPAILQKLRRGERIDHFESIRKCKDGRLVDVSLNVSPILDHAGKVTGASTIARDITVKKATEEALRQSEARFRSMYQQAQVGIEQVGIDGRLLMVNEALCKMLGYSEQELRSRTFEDITHPEDRERERQLLQPMLAGKVPRYDIEKRYIARDGTPVWVWVTSSAVRDAAGQPVYRVSVIQNISDKKQAQDALQQSAESRRLALQAAELGTWDYRFDKGEVLWDERCRDQFGFTAGDRIDYDGAIDRIHPDDRAGVDEAVERALAGNHNGMYHRQFRVRWPDGSLHWIDSYGRVHFDGKGDGRRPTRFIGVNADITERKQAEEALLQSEKLASVGRMAATIAHEINNPLEAVVNSLYLALQDHSLSDAARGHLRVADEQLGRVVQLTKQTLGFYRETRARTVVKVPALIDDVLSFFGRKLNEKHIVVHKRYDAENGIAPGTTGELRQVLANLIANSIDALPADGHLHVRVARCHVAADPMVRITVADSGHGISTEHVGRIFEPFFTTKEKVGTGLGLWITREIVQRHGGRVVVRTRPGTGTVFCIYLPAAEAAMAVHA